jgi:hypothetical protein
MENKNLKFKLKKVSEKNSRESHETNEQKEELRNGWAQPR